MKGGFVVQDRHDGPARALQLNGLQQPDLAAFIYDCLNSPNHSETFQLIVARRMKKKASTARVDWVARDTEILAKAPQSVVSEVCDRLGLLLDPQGS